MKALYQRLKELDGAAFETLCVHLLKERHPDVDIRHLEGAAGDEGVDVFFGELGDGPIVWQCKSFSRGVGKSQKEQIRASLKKVLRHVRPRTWVLCISVDMDVRTRRWFECLQRSYARKLSIGLMDASQIVHELMHRRTLRNAFFPGAALDTVELRSLVTRTGELSFDELEALTAENAEQYLERLKKRDARFTYEIVFGGDRGPAGMMPQPGLLVSVADTDRRINVFARDIEAIRLSPPKMNFTLLGPGIEKFMTFVRTGKSQEFGADELGTLTTDFAFITGTTGPLTPLMLRFEQRPNTEPFPVRVTFGSGSDAVTYPWMNFSVVRRGTEEIELVGKNDVPFELHAALQPAKGTGTVTILEHRVGADVHAIERLLRAVRAAKRTGSLEFYDLRHDKTLLKAQLGDLTDRDPRFWDFIQDAVMVADHYEVQLRLPRVLTEDDVVNLVSLKQLITGELITSGDLTVTLVKTAENAEHLRQLLGKENAIRCERSSLDPAPVLFGVSVDTGPVRVEFGQMTVKNAAYVREAIELPDGSEVELILTPTAPGKIVLIRNAP